MDGGHDLGLDGGHDGGGHDGGGHDGGLLTGFDVHEADLGFEAGGGGHDFGFDEQSADDLVADDGFDIGGLEIELTLADLNGFDLSPDFFDDPVEMTTTINLSLIF